MIIECLFDHLRELCEANGLYIKHQIKSDNVYYFEISAITPNQSVQTWAAMHSKVLRDRMLVMTYMHGKEWERWAACDMVILHQNRMRDVKYNNIPLSDPLLIDKIIENIDYVFDTHIVDYSISNAGV